MTAVKQHPYSPTVYKQQPSPKNLGHLLTSSIALHKLEVLSNSDRGQQTA